MPADYSELGVLMWTVILVSLVVPFIAVSSLLNKSEQQAANKKVFGSN